MKKSHTPVGDPCRREGCGLPASEHRERLSHAQKLVIAGKVAPTIRKKWGSRRIFVQTADGDTRPIDEVELARKLAERIGVEIDPNTVITCLACGQLRSSGRGKVFLCRSCSKKVQHTKWYRDNLDKARADAREVMRRHRAANREAINKRQRDECRLHPELKRERARRYREKNAEKIAVKKVEEYARYGEGRRAKLKERYANDSAFREQCKEKARKQHRTRGEKK